MSVSSKPGRRDTRNDVTDGRLSQHAPASSVREWWHDAVDQLAGSDPGLTRLRSALQAVLSVGLAIALAYLLVRATGEMQIATTAAPAAVVSTQHHAALIVAMMVAAIIALMSSFSVNEPTWRGQVITSVLLPVPMAAAVSIGFALGSYRAASIVWLGVALVIGVYLRKYGPRGNACGLVMFQGAFMGFFLHTVFTWRDLGWLTLDMALGVVASALVRWVVLRTDTVHTLSRMRRSWLARAHRVLTLSLRVLQSPAGEVRRKSADQLRRQLIRLNESTLLIEAHLGDPSMAGSAAAAHQRLFTHELSLANLARFAEALSARELSNDLTETLVGVLSSLLEDDLDAAERGALQLGARAATDCDARTGLLLDRLAGSALALVALRRAELAGDDSADGQPSPFADQVGFTPAVELQAGWLPGSAATSANASMTAGTRLLDRSVFAPHVRAAIQMAVAASIALSVGDVISPRRLYWAALATFLSFMATSNSGEQIRKAMGRAVGTAAGIVLGDLLVHGTRGNPAVSIVAVLGALFLGVYLMRISYGFMAMSITIATAQLYDQLDEFSFHLLLLRLAETSVGVGAVIVTVLVVVPLRPQRVLTAGLSDYYDALHSTVFAVLDALVDPRVQPPSRADVRALDAAYASLNVTAQPLQRGVFGHYTGPVVELLAITAACRNYARTLTANVQRWSPVPAADAPALGVAIEQLRASMTAVQARLRNGGQDSYVRSAALFEQVRDTGERARVLRDLMLLDGALARLAGSLRMPISDHDTCHSDVRDDADRDQSATVSR